MATIDELTIEVQTKAKDIDNRLDNVAKQLENLATAVGKVNTGSLKDIGVGFSALSTGMQGFKSIKMPDFTRLYKGLGKVSDVDSTKIKNVADAINPLANSIKTLNGVNFDSKNITGLINSLIRLSNANVSSLENVDFSKIGGEINSLTHSLQGAEKVSNNTISITNAVAKLASAGAKADIVSAYLPKLGNELRDFIQKMSGASKVSQETIQFTQALGMLASEGNKTATTAGNLGSLATELKKFMQVMSTAPVVNGNIIQMTNALANLASQGGRVGSASNGLVRSFNNISTGAKKTHKNILNLAASFGRFYAIFWGIKRAIGALSGAVEYASDLTEVQNVIDVTFGNAKGVIEDFSQSAIKQFGISELAAKQTAGRFQAMGTAIGFSQGKMADMSVELTALSADMASFYNVSQKEVATSLQSIFTGETEPMRRYGIDLTQATLQEWALKQGIDADMQSMSQAEKVMLRYQYVIANTGAATGDFARTSASWANQVRILSEQFKVLGSVIGKGIIAAFKPFIQTLNKVMAKVITFSENVLNALGKIFGWQFEITGGGITDDLGDTAGYTDDIASGAGDASDGYKDATKNAKKLKDVVLGIDELNINAPDNDTGSTSGSSGKPGGSGGSGAGAEVGTGGLTTNMFVSDTVLKAYESSIDSLYELGEYIGKTLTKAMKSIRWEEVYESARNFGKGLADFLNGLISPDLFGTVGRTIAGSLNAVVYAALSFAETFDWKEFGLSIATGVNEFFKTFDFSSVAKTINTWVGGIFNAIFTAVDNTDWGLIGRKIGTFIAEIDILKAIGKLGKAVWKAINAAIKTYAGTFSKAPVETALLSLMVIPKSLRAIIDTKFIQGIATLAKKFEKFGGAAKLAFQVFTGSGGNAAVFALAESFPRLSKAVDVSRQAFLNFKQGIVDGNIFTGLNAGISTVRDGLTKMQKGVIGAASVFTEFSLVKSGVYDLAVGTDNLVASIGKIAAGAGVAVAALKLIGLSNPFTAVVTGATALIAAFVGVNRAMNEITENSMFETLETNGTVSLKSLGDVALNTFEKITNGVDETIEKLNGIENTKESINSTIENIGGIQRAIDSGAYSVSEKVPQIIEQFQGLLNQSKKVFDEEYDVIVGNVVGAWADILEAQGVAVPETVAALASLREEGKGAYTELESSISSLTCSA